MKSQRSALFAAVLLSLTASAFATDSGEEAEAANAEEPVAQAAGEAPAATAKSADDVARELANPNNSLASLTFKNQYRWYTGDLPDADDQGNYLLLFQPTFPFPLETGDEGRSANLFIRPAIPLLVNQPVFNSSEGGFDDASAIGDIGFDLAYGVTEANGLLWAVGMVATLPTATDDDVAGDQYRLGPEFLVAKFEKWGVYGIFPSHQWRVGGSNDSNFSNTQIQGFLRFLPGGGWNVGSSPIMNYDWESEQWTIPLSLSASRTVMLGAMPVKVELEINYYVEQPDAFGPEWMLSFNLTPVVKNIINEWVRGF